MSHFNCIMIQFNLLQIRIMDPATLTFIIGICGALILLLISLIGWLINFIVKTQKDKNDEVTRTMKELSRSIDNQNKLTTELKIVVQEISIGCKFRHDQIEKFMRSFDE